MQFVSQRGRPLRDSHVHTLLALGSTSAKPAGFSSLSALACSFGLLGRCFELDQQIQDSALVFADRRAIVLKVLVTLYQVQSSPKNAHERSGGTVIHGPDSLPEMSVS
jgi:hypothetical protein